MNAAVAIRARAADFAKWIRRGIDGWTVVDSVGSVKGVAGLRVVDASIIPKVPSSTTNVTVIMLAERIFQRIYAG